MVLIPPGTFQMGCSPGLASPCDGWETPVHTVTLSQPYYLGRYEVTQAQWVAKMGSNPSEFHWQSDAQSRPVDSVSWEMAQGFLTSTGMRFPTEAEWEFAYRAGTMTAYHSMPGYPSGTNDEAQTTTIAWRSGNASGQTHAVGTKAGNGFGLHDMSGNVWEWCYDRLGSYESSAQTDPVGPDLGMYRVIRGGAWDSSSGHCRSSYRGGHAPDWDFSHNGFRVARSP